MACDQSISPNGGRSSENLRFVVRCNHCKSENTVKRGFRKTQNRGKIQRYLCKECNRTFTQNTGFWKYKNNEKRICQAIDTYYEGLSSRKVKRNLETYSNTEISHQTILNWVRDFTQKISRFVRKIKPNLLYSTQYTDETTIRTNREKHQLGLVMDFDTRMIVAWQYWEKSMGLESREIAELWSKAEKVHRPVKWRTDGLHGYEKAFNKVFYTHKKHKQVKWIRHVTEKTGKFNFTMERLMRNLKDRLRTIYGFKAVESAKTILEGWIIYYNFIRPHMGLGGLTPAQKAGIQLRIGANKWLGMINQASLF